MARIKSPFPRYTPIIFIVCLLLTLLGTTIVLYINPHILMTNDAMQLKGADLVKAQNDVRSHLVQLTGAILVLGTLCFTFWNTRIAKENIELAKARFEQEKKDLWAEKVREAYSEWAGLFVGATKVGMNWAEAKANGNKAGEEELFSKFQDLHGKAEVITYRIYMLEKRNTAIEAFKKLNSEIYPDNPLPDQTKNDDFWAIAERDRDIMGEFHGLVKKRLTAFSEWLSTDTSLPFEMPTNANYIDYLRKRGDLAIE